MGFVYIVHAFVSMYTTKIMIIIHILIFIFDFNMSFNKADYIINCCRPYILWFAFGLGVAEAGYLRYFICRTL